MKKKFLALLLAALMVVSLLPAVAFATESAEPLCFTAGAANSTVRLNYKTYSSKEASANIVYSTDGKNTWKEYKWGACSSNLCLGDEISLPNIGDKVYFKADPENENKTFDVVANDGTTDYYYFSLTGANMSASGDVTTLLNANGVSNLSDTTGGRNWTYCFTCLFMDCSTLTTAPELPATTLAEACYSSMFYGCSALTTVPELPATNLTNNCYSSMFRGCTSLVNAPKLPATTMASYCYNNMFRDCTSLVNAPKLPATTLAEACYQLMFRGCANLSCVAFSQATPPEATATDALTSFIPTTAKIVVPPASVTAYKEATGWSAYANQIVGAYLINIADTEHGTVTADKEYVATDAESEVVTLTVTPDEGYQLKSLKYNDGEADHDITKDSTSGKYQFTMPLANVTVMAEFDKSVCSVNIDGTTTYYTSFNEALNSACAPATLAEVKLLSDIDMHSSPMQIIIPQSCDLTLDLNGHTLTCFDIASNPSMIFVQQLGTLTIDDKSEDHNGKITGANATAVGYGGTIWNEGTVYLKNGEITNSTASFAGGAVYNRSDAIFVMSGGKITSCSAATFGGGIFNLNGSVNIEGGIISGCTVTNTSSADEAAGLGAAVWSNNGLTMSGGTIQDCTSAYAGGAVFIDGVTDPHKELDSVFSFEGNAIIKDCESADEPMDCRTSKEAIYIRNAKMVMNGGTIEGDIFANDRTDEGRGPACNIIIGDGKLKGSFTNNDNRTTDGGITVSPCSVSVTGGLFSDDTLKAYVASGYNFTDNTNNATKSEYPYTVVSAYTPSYSGGESSSTVTVPVTGDENTVKVSATVSGSTAAVKEIKAEDLEKVTEGASVSIDLSATGKNVDTAKIPTETVEKIAEKSSMTVKLPVATVEFDKAATEEIADQAKGSNIELVVDDVKEVSLNAVQKEAVGKLDTAIIIDAYLESNGSKLCTSDNGGFGGGSAKVILPYEIKNNRKPENYSVFYVNEAGKLEKLNAVYDEELKAFVFEIEHFSVYAVAFEQFVDIDVNAYYYDAVKWAAANGITDGTDSTHFSPNGITNRGQMVTFLWKAAGKPEPTITEIPFTDLDPDWYYYKAVLWAYENGITDGTSATTFEPNKNVSRAQVVTFLWRYAGKPYVDYFMNMSDVASGKYYTEAVRWALAEKITEGTTTTTFSPNDDCLRGQIVTFLYRSLVK